MFLHSTLFVISFGSLFYVNNQTSLFNCTDLYKDNMLIKEACLLLVGEMDSRRGCLTVASLSSAGPCTVETVQHFILQDVWRTHSVAMQCNSL